MLGAVHQQLLLLEFRQGTDLVADLPHQLREIDRFENQVGVAGIGAGQGQHVLQEMRSFDGLGMNFRKALPGFGGEVRVAERSTRPCRE